MGRCRWMAAGAVLLKVILAGVAAEDAGGGDDPADEAFLLKAARSYYEALAAGDFDATAKRELFAVLDTRVDLPAYRKAMRGHPWASAERIVVDIKDMNAARAYLELTVTEDGRTFTRRATWSRTGSPKRWLVQMTTMTMAGMPEYQVIEDDPPAAAGRAATPAPSRKPVSPRVTSRLVRRRRNPQDGVIAGANDGAVRFARPPKVMPTTKMREKYPDRDIGQGSVLGFVKNTGETAARNVRIKAVVRSASGEVLESREFALPKKELAPGKRAMFSGYLDHLDPARTEFSLVWEP